MCVSVCSSFILLLWHQLLCLVFLFHGGFFFCVLIGCYGTWLDCIWCIMHVERVPFHSFVTSDNFWLSFTLSMLFFFLLDALRQRTVGNKSWFELIHQQKKFHSIVFNNSRFILYHSGTHIFVWFDTVCSVYSICHFVYTILTSVWQSNTSVNSSPLIKYIYRCFSSGFVNGSLAFLWVFQHMFSFFFFLFVCSFIYLFLLCFVFVYVNFTLYFWIYVYFLHTFFFD